MDEKFERHEIDMDLLNEYLEDKDYLKLKTKFRNTTQLILQII